MKMLLLLAVVLMCIAAFVLLHRDTPGTTIHLAGDSTMSVQLAAKRPVTGWGEPLNSMLCEGIRLINHAKNGRSTRSFLSEGLWQALLTQLRDGDIVLIQFGHNDQKSDNSSLHTRPWQDYRDNLQSFVVDVRERGAKPVLITPLVRRNFDSQGQLLRTLGDYPSVTRAVASEMRVELIDLNDATHELIEAMGPEASKKLFVHLAPDAHENHTEGIQDDTHLNAQGAMMVATLVADELKTTLPGLICR